MSGRRDSDARPSAWEADALPAELLPPGIVYGLKVEKIFGKFQDSKEIELSTISLIAFAYTVIGGMVYLLYTGAEKSIVRH